MENRLIFIGGPPGVGKSTVVKCLQDSLENSIWLDGDDVGRMNPFIVNEKKKAMVENNVQYVLNSFISAQFPFILFTWVLHKNTIVDSILDRINLNRYKFFHFTLTCDDSVLMDRITSDKVRTTDLSLARNRLENSRLVNSEKVDTTNMEVAEVASKIIKRITA